MRSNLIGRQNVRFLIATALGGVDMLGFVKSLSKKQIDDINYDRGTEINLGTTIADNQKMTRQVDIPTATDILVQATANAAKVDQIEIPCNEVTLRTGIATWLRSLYGEKTTVSLKDIFNALMDIKSAKSYGPWNGWTTTTVRLIAAIGCAALGKDWLIASFTGVAGKVEYALGVYLYDVNSVVVGEEIDHEAVAKATPKAIAVIGQYMTGDNVVTGRYVGSLKELPMVGHDVMALPAFAPLQPNSPSLRAILDVIRTGKANMNRMFKSPNGGYFTFTKETLEMSRFNPDGFIAQISAGFDCTNGNVGQVKKVTAAYGTASSARSTFLKTLVSGVILTPSKAHHAFQHGNASSTPSFQAPVNERELVSAGVEHGFGSNDSPFKG